VCGDRGPGDFLKQLSGKSLFLHVQPYESWTSKRMHRRLLKLDVTRRLTRQGSEFAVNRNAGGTPSCSAAAEVITDIGNGGRAEAQGLSGGPDHPIGLVPIRRIASVT
jgi:hypothetical protein